jgi:diguanylate cyclase (GGDEF)-like protein
VGYLWLAVLGDSTSHISRVQGAREDLAKAWLVELVERTPLDELGGIGVEWLAREAPPLIAAILSALSEPGRASERALQPTELRRAAELRQLRTGDAAPASLPRDLAALQSLLIEALRREIPERETGEFARTVERLAEVFGTLQGAIAEDLVRERSGDAARDSATGLPGAAELYEWMRIVLAGERRYGNPFTLMLIDVDGLGLIADAYGAQAGERMLRAVTDVVANQIRAVDRAFRLADDQLCVLLPQQGPLPTLALADRLASIVEESQGIDGPRVAVSIGIASCPEHGNSAEVLLAAAEEANFSAKAAGERVAVASAERGVVSD